jgi:hypothetical protein
MIGQLSYTDQANEFTCMTAWMTPLLTCISPARENRFMVDQESWCTLQFCCLNRAIFRASIRNFKRIVDVPCSSELSMGRVDPRTATLTQLPPHCMRCSWKIDGYLTLSFEYSLRQYHSGSSRVWRHNDWLPQNKSKRWFLVSLRLHLSAFAGSPYTKTWFRLIVVLYSLINPMITIWWQTPSAFKRVVRARAITPPKQQLSTAVTPHSEILSSAK